MQQVEFFPPQPNLVRYVQQWTQVPTMTYALLVCDDRSYPIHNTRLKCGQLKSGPNHLFLPVDYPVIFELSWNFKTMQFELDVVMVGVLVNGKAVTRAGLCDGDVISFGSFKTVYQSM